jgi:hypothetical protein
MAALGTATALALVACTIWTLAAVLGIAGIVDDDPPPHPASAAMIAAARLAAKRR